MKPTRKQLEAIVSQAGIYMATYSPGDGVTRYRFFNNSGNSYFGPENGTYTALGLKEAVSYAQGRLDAANANGTAKSYENAPGVPCVPLEGWQA